jgi:radical SAM superfamily enzyme YgiQ (UPF0313 family)
MRGGIVITNMSSKIDDALNELFPLRLIKRVLLVAPPDADQGLFTPDVAHRGRYWNFAPYGLGVIARLLLDDGLDVRIVNLNHEILKRCRTSNKEEFIFDLVWQECLSREVKDFAPDFVGVTCMFTQTHRVASQVCAFLRECLPTVPLALGGVHITNCFVERGVLEHLLDDYKTVDMFFLYEAEYAVRDFIRIVNDRETEDGLYQVHFTKQNLTCEKHIFPKGKALDVLPAHELMHTAELSRYGVIGSFFCLKEPTTRFTTILSNRGCRGSCTFCSVSNFNGKGVRSRSIHSIVEELIYLRDTFNIGHVMWLDDDLFFDRRRAVALFNEIARRNIKITWDCSNGVIAASCQEELIAAAAESGCVGLNIGVESGSPEILKSTKKPARIQNFFDAATVLKRYPEINARVFLMIGFPGETVGMMLNTYQVALDMDLDWYNITILQPLPNTLMFDKIYKESESLSLKAEDVRFNSGAYGKRRKHIKRNLIHTVGSGLGDMTSSYVPSCRELDDIWFSMNFNLNFARLLNVDNPVKLNQHLRYLKTITEIIAPDDPFPIYFYGALQEKVAGRIDPELIDRIERCLAQSDYWRACFKTYGLDIEHLRSSKFPMVWPVPPLGGHQQELCV